MIVDDDDFVSNRLVTFVAQNAGRNGWYMRVGYVWSSNGRLVYRDGDFSNICGTSHIVRADLYTIPARVGRCLRRLYPANAGQPCQNRAIARGGRASAGAATLPGSDLPDRASREPTARKSWGLIGKFLLPGLARGPCRICPAIRPASIACPPAIRRGILSGARDAG